MSSTQTYSEIREKFAAVVAKSLHVPVEKVTEDVYLDQLGAESLDLIEITMDAEEACNVCIPEKSILQTAIEVFGPNVLEVNGVLTNEGKALLRSRMPDAEILSATGEITIKDINREFMKVGNWVRMLAHLAEHTRGTYAPRVRGLRRPTHASGGAPHEMRVLRRRGCNPVRRGTEQEVGAGVLQPALRPQ
jgi:acyl carrier protein